MNNNINQKDAYVDQDHQRGYKDKEGRDNQIKNNNNENNDKNEKNDNNNHNLNLRDIK